MKSVSVAQAAKMLNKSTKTIYTWCETGKLKAWKGPGPTSDKWYISLESVEEIKHNLEEVEQIKEKYIEEEPISVEVIKKEPLKPVPVYDITRPVIQEIEEKLKAHMEIEIKAAVAQHAASFLEVNNNAEALEKVKKNLEEVNKYLEEVRKENQELRLQNKEREERYEKEIKRLEQQIQQQNKKPWWKIW